MKRRRRRGFRLGTSTRICEDLAVDSCYILRRKEQLRGGEFMEEMAPAVALPLGIGNSVCERPIEIACLKLMADTASILMPPSAMAEDLGLEKNTQLRESENGNDIKIQTIPGSDEDDSVSVDTHKGISNDMEIIAGPVLGELGISVNLLPAIVEQEVKGKKRSVYLLDYFPLWGCISMCGRRPEMEDSVVAVPRFFEIPLQMVAGDRVVDGLDTSAIRLPAHFFGVYDGHGGAQVADYCRERIHQALIEELQSLDEYSLRHDEDGLKKQWEKAFTDCFQKVDDEVGGKVRESRTGDEDSNVCSVPPSEPLAPETVGSTAVVAVICSSHIIVANCGDSRAVLCRGKLPIALSADHKPNREDEYARIEAGGGKVIQWNGYRVCGVLAMSRAIGDRYLKPWIIPEPEVMIIPRTKEDDCLILASDGLWDVMSNEEACDAARRRIALWHKRNGVTSASAQNGEEADPAAQAASEYLLKLALQKGSKDNITVIVIDLKAQRKFKA